MYQFTEEKYDSSLKDSKGRLRSKGYITRKRRLEQLTKTQQSLFFNILEGNLYQTEELRGDSWELVGNLQFFDNTVYFCDDPLANVHWHPIDNKVRFLLGEKGDLGEGVIWFRDHKFAFSGYYQKKGMEHPVKIRGRIPQISYHLSRNGKEQITIQNKWEKNFCLVTNLSIPGHKFSYQKLKYQTQDAISGVVEFSFFDHTSDAIFTGTLQAGNHKLQGKLKSTASNGYFSGQHYSKMAKLNNEERFVNLTSYPSSETKLVSLFNFNSFQSLRENSRSTSLERVHGSDTELLSINTFELEDNGEGESIPVDQVQVLAGEYYENNLKYALKELESNIDNESYFGEAVRPKDDEELNLSEVEKVLEDYHDLYLQIAPLYCAQLVCDSYQDQSEDDNDDLIKVRGWDMCKIANVYKDLKKSDEYKRMFDRLYAIAYTEYLANELGIDFTTYLENADYWQNQLITYYEQDSTLEEFVNSVILDNELTDPMVEIKNIANKIQLLGNEEKAQEIQKNYFSATLQAMARDVKLNGEASAAGDGVLDRVDAAQQVMMELLQNASQETREVMKTYSNSVGGDENMGTAFIADLRDIYNHYPDRDLNVMDDFVRSSLVEKNSSVFNNNISTGVLDSMTYGVSLSSLLFSLTRDKDINIPELIGFGATTLDGTIGLIEAQLSTRLAAFLAKKSATTKYTFMQQITNSLSKWVKSGLPEGSIAGKIFGSSLSKFAVRFTAVTAVIGLAISAYDLVQAIINNDPVDIILGSINAAIGLGGCAVAIGVMAGAAWAGPVGVAVAIVGFVVALIQFLIKLFEPKPPKPDPIGEFTDTFLNNYIYPRNRYSYVFIGNSNDGGIRVLEEENGTVLPIESLSNKEIKYPDASVYYNGYIYCYGVTDSHTPFRFREQEHSQVESITLPYGAGDFISCCLIDNTVYALVDDIIHKELYSWNIDDESPDLEGSYLVEDNKYNKITRITTDGDKLYLADNTSIYSLDPRELNQDTPVEPELFCQYIEEGFEYSWEFVSIQYDDGFFYVITNESLFRIDPSTPNHPEVTEIFTDKNWKGASFRIRHEDDRSVLVSCLSDDSKYIRVAAYKDEDNSMRDVVFGLNTTVRHGFWTFMTEVHRLLDQNERSVCQS
ncbi:hypothetical protein [Zooshikella sp. RANM57]|uniref:hypothetical protein n=1 Tax=Zooshikella sp. RANM57 TaxID=3425863 RepID=UPI003D6E7558